MPSRACTPQGVNGPVNDVSAPMMIGSPDGASAAAPEVSVAAGSVAAGSVAAGSVGAGGGSVVPVGHSLLGRGSLR